MSFSPEWLALREPADHAARSTSLMARLGRHFAGRERISVVDLGCGAGSNLRGVRARRPASRRPTCWKPSLPRKPGVLWALATPMTKS